MKRNNLCWGLISILILIIFPLGLLNILKEDLGMALCYMLFYFVNPMYFIFLGGLIGRNFKEMWSTPIVAIIIFLLGAVFTFKSENINFLNYSGLYLLMSILSALIIFYLIKIRNHRF